MWKTSHRSVFIAGKSPDIWGLVNLARSYTWLEMAVGGVLGTRPLFLSLASELSKAVSKIILKIEL